MRVLDGKAIAEERERALAGRVRALAESGLRPKLAVVLPCDDPAAALYVRTKQRLAVRLGIEVEIQRPPSPTTQSLVQVVSALSGDPDTTAIVVEAPLPPGVDADAVRDAVPPRKDVDGAGTGSLGRLLAGGEGFAPATAEAAVCLLRAYGIPIAGRHAVVVGRSLVVGRPLALLLLRLDATVTVAHSRTPDLPSITREADVVCVAAGRPGLLVGSMLRVGAAVVDIGANVVAEKLVGDVDWATVCQVAGAASPVPGGVGPLTNVVLLEHVVDAAERVAR